MKDLVSIIPSRKSHSQDYGLISENQGDKIRENKCKQAKFSNTIVPNKQNVFMIQMTETMNFEDAW